MKFQFIKFFLRCLSALPLSACRRIGNGAGHLLWLTNSRMKDTTLTNLRLCMPELTDDERKSLAKDSLKQTMQTLMESGAVWLWAPDRILSYIHNIEGKHVLEQASAEGRGVIVLAPHLGNWELLGLYLNSCGLGQSYQLYQAPDDPGLNALIFQARSRAGASMVATDNKGVAQLLKALRGGAIAGILPDQVPPRSGGVYAPFFGVPALTMTLLNKLQNKTGAKIVSAYIKRSPGDVKEAFTLVFREPDNKIYAKDMPEALAAMNRSVEQLVLEAPEQYQWEYKRFKRQAEGSPAYYQR